MSRPLARTIRQYFGLTDRAVARIINGDSDHEVLFNQPLDDAAAKHFNYSQPVKADA